MTFAPLSIRCFVPTSISARPASRRVWLKLVVLALVVVALLGGAQTARAQLSCSQLASQSGRTTGEYTFTAGSVITTNITSTPEDVSISDLNYNLVAGPYTTVGSFTYTVVTTGIYYVFAEYSGGYTVSCAAPQTTFTVTTTADDATGIPANCATGSSTACTLRDALAAAAASTLTSLTVNFSPNLAGSSGTTPFTITEVKGTLNIPANTVISGLTTGTGASLTNLTTVSGNSLNSVFTEAAGVTGAVLNNLNIVSGSASNGGGIYMSGTLTVNSCTVSGNSAADPNNPTPSGGGIFVDGHAVLLLNGSTITMNSAYEGAGVFSGHDFSDGHDGMVTVQHSTITGNTASYLGGGLTCDFAGHDAATVTNSTIVGNSAYYYAGIYGCVTTLNNSIVANNVGSGAPSLADMSSGWTGAGNIAPSASSGGSATTSLSPLGSYGGPTQTMPTLPSSNAFCLTQSTTAFTAATDQRGFSGVTNYAGTYCADAGATNSKYGVAITTQPNATIAVGASFPSTAPVASFQDNGYTIPAPYSMVFQDSAGLLNGSGTVIVPWSSSGTANLSSASIGSAVSSDTVTASYGINTNGIATTFHSAPSNAFAVVAPPVTGFTISTLSGVTAGTAQSVTVTALNGTSTSTNYTGTVTFTSTDTAAGLPASYTFTSTDAGVHTFTNGVTFKTAGASQTITVADTSANVSKTSNAVAVTAASAASITAASGSGKSATIGAAFALPLQVQVLDAYSNAINGNVVTFTVPTTGASASLSATTCTTDTTGKCSVTATANGTASTTSYSVTAKATGVTTGTTFTLTNNAVTPTLTVTASPTTLVYGQPVTITATSSPLSAGGSSPTSAVTFYDNSTTLTPTVTPTAGVATFATTALVGAQVYGASTAGDTNFSAVAKTTASSITVGKASSTLTGPATQPVQVTVNTAGPIAVSIAGQYSGTGITAPSGSLSYTIGSPCATSCTGTAAISSNAASLSLPTTLAPGPYTIAVTYAGDTNYAAATTINVSVQIGKITPVVTYPSAGTIPYGTTLSAVLNATVAAGGTSLTSAGTMTYTGTYNGPGGFPGPVTSTVVLPVNSWILTATWTPDAAHSATYAVATGTTILTVSAVNLTVAANPASMIYGGTLPGYSVSYTGFVNGDSGLLGAPAFTTTPANPVNAGTYTITPSIGTLLPQNYNLIGFTPSTLTINKAVLTVGANSITVPYGTPLPAFTTSITGFVNGDSQATAVTGAPVVTSTPAAPTGVGVYPLSVSAGNLAAANYTFAGFNGATLTITKGSLTVAANPITIFYGQPLPAYTYTMTGFGTGDTQATATLGQPVLTTVPAIPSGPGVYAIAPSIGTLTATNYNFTTFTPANLTINKAASSVVLSQLTPATTGTGVGVSTTFSATVIDATAGSTGTPTGTVSFYANGALIGSAATLSGGVATITTMFSSIGAVTVTAQYAGDSYFTASTANTLVVPVVTPNVTATATPSSLTLTQGQTGTVVITFTPTGGYTGTATLSCGTVPANATCSFAPSTVTFSGSGTPVTSTLTFATTLPMARGGALEGGLVWIPALALASLLLVRKRKVGALLVLIVGFAMMSVTGCAGDAVHTAGTPKGTTNVSVNVALTSTTPGVGSSTLSVAIPITVQ